MSNTDFFLVPSTDAGRLPFSCDFESGLCDFVQDSEDNFDWKRTRQATPTSDTGPNSANKGSYYIFTEASSPRREKDQAM